VVPGENIYRILLICKKGSNVIQVKTDTRHLQTAFGGKTANWDISKA
jgi:hypothetical protein